MCNCTRFNNFVLTDSNVIPNYQVRKTAILVLVMVGILRAQMYCLWKVGTLFQWHLGVTHADARQIDHPVLRFLDILLLLTRLCTA
jgi:hypothetical protein